VWSLTAFAAARKSPLPYASGAVSYPERILDTKQAFNDSTNAFYVIKTPGFYFIHFSAGVPGYQFVNYALRDASSTPNIILTHKVHACASSVAHTCALIFTVSPAL
jgi:hypothetical protein